MDRLAALEAWYAAHCDGEWEHGYGVSIDTIDNPGWEVLIDIPRGELKVPLDWKFGEFEGEAEEPRPDWVECRLEPGKPADDIVVFNGCSGPRGLGELIRLFLSIVAHVPGDAETASASELDGASKDRRER